MSMDEKTTAHVAELAKIAVNETDLTHYTRDLGNMLDMVETMQKVNTEGVNPMSHPLLQPARLRDDWVSEVDEHQRMQAIAPKVQKGLYLVPKVVE